MGEIYDGAKERQISWILDRIDERKIALPNFQRSYVWLPSQTVRLLASVMSGYPMGAVLALRVDQNVHLDFLQPLAVAGAPQELDPAGIDLLILDGQQRLTSLYQALRGAGDTLYFLSLDRLNEGADLEEAIVALKRNPWRLRDRDYVGFLQTQEGQAQRRMIPFSAVYGTRYGFLDWAKEISQHAPNPEAFREELEELVYDEYIRHLEDYLVPIIQLSPRTGNEAVCAVFETLNDTGTRLSIFDLMVAKLFPSQVNLKQLWTAALDDYPVLESFGANRVHVLWALALLEEKLDPTGRVLPPSARKDRILSLSPEHVAAMWGPVTEGFVQTLTLLEEECGVVTPKLLTYAPMLVPMAAIYAKHYGMTGTALKLLNDKLVVWYWCTLLSQAYAQGAQGRAASDYQSLCRWVENGTVPAVVRDFRLEPEDLQQAKDFGSAVYQGVIALLLSLNPKDFQDGKQIRERVRKADAVDVHHVFPDQYLRDHGYAGQPNKSMRDTVVNKTLINATTNRRIKKRAPSDYMPEISDALGVAAFQAMLESHLLPAEALLDDDYPKFLSDREEMLLSEIRRVTAWDAGAEQAGLEG